MLGDGQARNVAPGAVHPESLAVVVVEPIEQERTSGIGKGLECEIQVGGHRFSSQPLSCLWMASVVPIRPAFDGYHSRRPLGG